MPQALRVSGLTKAYGALVVTRDLGFEVAEGEALGIIGPNGAGKTTLFNLVAGTVRPDAGTVEYFGHDVTGASARRRCLAGISRSFQVPQPFAGLTAFENALVAAAFGRGLSEAAARPHAARALELTGLARRADALAGSLTLLDRKRLELARSIATGPRLLMLDEIAGGLTNAECAELVALIRQIRAEGVTILWVEHVLHALLAVIDRLVVVDFGQKIADGDPDAVMGSPEVASVYLGPDADEEGGGISGTGETDIDARGDARG